jgi:hypothetical protein
VEFTAASFGFLPEDSEWRKLLIKNMPDYSEGIWFWRKFYALCRYPELDKAGKAILEELLKD